MKTVKAMILTVNPAEQTVGSLHPEAAMKMMRRKLNVEGASVAKRKSGGMLRALFGPTSVTPSRSRMLLMARLLFGGIMMAYGMIRIEASLIEGVYLFAMASALMMGVGTRFLMIANAVCFGIMSGMMIEVDEFPAAYMLMTAMSIVIAMAGPGGYSVDAVLRQMIFRSIKRYETRRLMERRFSYRAYQYAHLYVASPPCPPPHKGGGRPGVPQE